MGQKVNPHGLRVGVIKDWDSRWYADADFADCLVEDYNIIVRQRPILSKEGTLAIRYEIQDNFISFWFNYFDKNRSLIEIKNYMALRSIIKADYPTYSGKCWNVILSRNLRKAFYIKI